MKFALWLIGMILLLWVLWVLLFAYIGARYYDATHDDQTGNNDTRDLALDSQEVHAQRKCNPARPEPSPQSDKP
jgi:hypothetical protein